jgi:hypothetical protein
VRVVTRQNKFVQTSFFSSRNTPPGLLNNRCDTPKGTKSKPILFLAEITGQTSTKRIAAFDDSSARERVTQPLFRLFKQVEKSFWNLFKQILNKVFPILSCAELTK